MLNIQTGCQTYSETSLYSWHEQGEKNCEDAPDLIISKQAEMKERERGHVENAERVF